MTIDVGVYRLFYVNKHVCGCLCVQRHGLRVGDEILAVNGNDVTTMSSANADLLIMQYLTIKLDVRCVALLAIVVHG